MLFLLPHPATLDAPTGKKPSAGAKGAAGLASVLNPTILSLVVFFALLGLSGNGINNFGVSALMADKGLTWSAPTRPSRPIFAMSALGVLAGGYLADRTKRHGDVAALGFGLNALFVLCVALFPMPALFGGDSDGHRAASSRA